MYCQKCGQYNTDNSVFCVNCGASFQSANRLQPAVPGAYPPPAGYTPQGAYPPYSPPQPPKKGRTGLIVGLIVGGVLLAAAAVALVLLLPGGLSVEGIWYNEESSTVLEFRDTGRVTVYTSDGDIKCDYEFDKRTGEGVIIYEDDEAEFILENSKLVIDDDITYRRADEDFDIGDFITETAIAVSEEPELPSATETPPEPSPPAVQTVSDQTMTLSFAFGDRTGTYTGEVLDGLPNGYGTFTSQNPDGLPWTYEGGWENGHFSGQGTTTYGDGWVDTGLHENDEFIEGQVYTPEYLLYDGSLQDGYWHGYGTYYNPHGETVYSGYWSNGYIQESAEQRAARLAAFQASSVALSVGDLYTECAAESGAHVQFQGVVLQIYDYSDDPTMCECLMYMDGIEDAEHVVSIWYQLSEGEARPAEGQAITVWGTADNLFSYTTTSDENLTVPNIEAWFVE